VPIYTNILFESIHQFKKCTFWKEDLDGTKQFVYNLDLTNSNPFSSKEISKLSKKAKSYWLTVFDGIFKSMGESLGNEMYSSILKITLEFTGWNTSFYEFQGKLKQITFKKLAQNPIEATFMIKEPYSEMKRFWIAECNLKSFHNMMGFYKFGGLGYNLQNKCFLIEQINLRYIDAHKIGRYASTLLIKGNEVETPIGKVWIGKSLELIKAPNDGIPYPKTKQTLFSLKTN